MTEAMTDAPGGVHHVAIAVRDLALCEAFYASVLGLPVLRRWPAADGAEGDRSVWMDLGGGAFLALERASSGGDAPTGRPSEVADIVADAPGYLMIALRIARPARADWEARLAAAGVAVVHRTAYTLYVADPEGNRVGLSHWPEAAQPERG
jgi:glyoxylase I family protein